jgi:hypothetical protein
VALLSINNWLFYSASSIAHSNRNRRFSRADLPRQK